MSSSTIRLSGSCQQITHEDFGDPSSARLTVRCDLADSQISPIIAGHIINNIPLVPSGLYGDMAAVVGRYILLKLHSNPDTVPSINVCNMHVDKTFVPKMPSPPEGEWFEMESHANLSLAEERTAGTITCTFRKLNDPKLQDFAGCNIKFESIEDWRRDWAFYQTLIASQIGNLVSRAEVERSGIIRTIQRDQAYERFKTFVKYSIPQYQNMREIIMDYETLEATAVLDFQCLPDCDYVGPYYLDGSCHLSGWICNESEADSKKNAYISHGWGAMKLSSAFDPTSKTGRKGLRSYVRMGLQGKDVLAGDVFILREDEIVGVWEGVEFKRIPRRVLNVFLPLQKK